MNLLLIKEKCNQCGVCITVCHKGVCIFDIEKKEIKDMDYCNACLLCVSSCPEKALKVIR
jgi:Pyruvate/2-oxoacid:ferredoxin oxidoreductase delta subunit